MYACLQHAYTVLDYIGGNAEDKENEQFIMDASPNTQVWNKDFGICIHQEVKCIYAHKIFFSGKIAKQKTIFQERFFCNGIIIKECIKRVMDTNVDCFIV